jgi:hypothetical protein
MQANGASATDILKAHQPEVVAQLPRPEFERALDFRGLAPRFISGRLLAAVDHAINPVGGPSVDPALIPYISSGCSGPRQLRDPNTST